MHFMHFCTLFQLQNHLKDNLKRKKNYCKKHISSNLQGTELSLLESRWLGRWIDPPANETLLKRDSDSWTKYSARMSSYFKWRSNDVLALSADFITDSKGRKGLVAGRVPYIWDIILSGANLVLTTMRRTFL